MSILQRYIAKTVISATLIVVVVMLGLTFVINLLSELRDVGTGDYGFFQAVIHVVLELPHTIYQFFPMLVLMGGVLGLGVLASNQELVVMRSSGFSTRNIMGASIIAALLMIFVATVVGEWLAPKGYFIGETRKDSAQNGGQAVATITGIWMHEDNNFLHISRVIGLNHLEGVTRYQFNRQHKLLAAYYIKTMDIEKGRWLLHDVVKTSFNNNQTRSESFDNAHWDLVLNPNLLNVGLMDPAEMSLKNLYDYSQHFMQNGIRSASLRWEFWKRIFQPLTTLVMMLLAIPFVLRSSRSSTMGVRVLFGISVGFVFYILNAFLGQFSIVFQFSPILAAIFPTLLFAGMGYFFAMRARN